MWLAAKRVAKETAARVFATAMRKGVEVYFWDDDLVIRATRLRLLEWNCVDELDSRFYRFPKTHTLATHTQAQGEGNTSCTDTPSWCKALSVGIPRCDKRVIECELCSQAVEFIVGICLCCTCCQGDARASLLRITSGKLEYTD